MEARSLKSGIAICLLAMLCGCSWVQAVVCDKPLGGVDREYIANVQATRVPSIEALSIDPRFFSEEGKAKLQTILDGFAAQEAYERQKLGETPSKP